MMVRRMLRSLIQKLSHDAPTTLRVEFSDGSVYQSRAGSKADILIRFRSSSAKWRSLLFFYEGVLECYVNEEVDIEGDHPINALATIGHKGAADWLAVRSKLLSVMSAHLTRARLVRRVVPLLEIIADDLHRGNRRMAEVGIAGNFPADAFALAAQRVAHGLQLENDAFDLLHRSAGDAPNQRIQTIGGRVDPRVRLAALPAHERNVAPDKFADLTFERGRRCLIDVNQFFR
jgi:hypothetical protein